MKFLVLGGTKFIGRQVVTAALAAGHDVTLFNRGHTAPDLLATTKPLLGAYTVVGPKVALTFVDMLETCREVTGGHAVVDWAGDRTGFIVQPAGGSHDGTFQLSFQRALAAGLRLRPFAETARDALAVALDSGSHAH